MNKTTYPLHIDEEFYIGGDPEDGLYILEGSCEDCNEPIGLWEHENLATSFESFYPYWMLDEDANHNICEQCMAESHAN